MSDISLWMVALRADSQSAKYVAEIGKKYINGDPIFFCTKVTQGTSFLEFEIPVPYRGACTRRFPRVFLIPCNDVSMVLSVEEEGSEDAKTFGFLG